ncbi:hypothetical protein V1511DRAFT_136543 [Dipodascopsis uninucleata]
MTAYYVDTPFTVYRDHEEITSKNKCHSYQEQFNEVVLTLLLENPKLALTELSLRTTLDPGYNQKELSKPRNPSLLVRIFHLLIIIHPAWLSYLLRSFTYQTCHFFWKNSTSAPKLSRIQKFLAKILLLFVIVLHRLVTFRRFHYRHENLGNLYKQINS